jgi:hypothetical protein
VHSLARCQFNRYVCNAVTSRNIATLGSRDRSLIRWQLRISCIPFIQHLYKIIFGRSKRYTWKICRVKMLSLDYNNIHICAFWFGRFKPIVFQVYEQLLWTNSVGALCLHGGPTWVSWWCEEMIIFIYNMLIQPGTMIWSALHGACKIHKNVEEQLRNFCLLSHQMLLTMSCCQIYTPSISQGIWDEVAKVWKLMKEQGVENRLVVVGCR